MQDRHAGRSQRFDREAGREACLGAAVGPGAEDPGAQFLEARVGGCRGHQRQPGFPGDQRHGRRRSAEQGADQGHGRFLGQQPAGGEHGRDRLAAGVVGGHRVLAPAVPPGLVARETDAVVVGVAQHRVAAGQRAEHGYVLGVDAVGSRPQRPLGRRDRRGVAQQRLGLRRPDVGRGLAAQVGDGVARLAVAALGEQLADPEIPEQGADPGVRAGGAQGGESVGGHRGGRRGQPLGRVLPRRGGGCAVVQQQERLGGARGVPGLGQQFGPQVQQGGHPAGVRVGGQEFARQLQRFARVAQATRRTRGEQGRLVEAVEALVAVEQFVAQREGRAVVAGAVRLLQADEQALGEFALGSAEGAAGAVGPAAPAGAGADDQRQAPDQDPTEAAAALRHVVPPVGTAAAPPGAAPRPPRRSHNTAGGRWQRPPAFGSAVVQRAFPRRSWIERGDLKSTLPRLSSMNLACSATSLCG